MTSEKHAGRDKDCGPGVKGLTLAIEALGVKFGGGATVLNDLLLEGTQDERFSRIILFCAPKKVRRVLFPDSRKITEIECGAAESNRFYRLWWLAHGFGPRAEKSGADVSLSMCGTGVGSQTVPNVTFIQQSLPFCDEAKKLMNVVARARLETIFRAMKRSCASSERVIVQTHQMKRLVAAAFGTAPAKIEVAESAVRSWRAAGESPQLDSMRSSAAGTRLLYVGHEAKYKNLDVLIRAIARLRETSPDVCLYLTLPREHPLGRCAGVRCLGYLSGDALTEAYSLADILIMPSLQETVGLPLLEAMNAGTPVIAADRAYAREVCGDAAVFFDPLNEAELAAAIRELLTNETRRRHLASLGQALVEKRRLASPYRRMLDVAARVARPCQPA